MLRVEDCELVLSTLGRGRPIICAMTSFANFPHRSEASDLPTSEWRAAKKAMLRSELLARRNALSAAERAAEEHFVNERVQGWPQWERAATVCGYAAMGSEISCNRLLNEALELGKQVLLPACTSDKMLKWYQIEPGWRSRLIPHPFGMGEPNPSQCLLVDPVALDPETLLVIVPAVGLDPQTRGRLGYGGGYYDRFLATLNPTVTTLGIGYKCQQVALSNILETTDIPLHRIISASPDLCGWRQKEHS